MNIGIHDARGAAEALEIHDVIFEDELEEDEELSDLSLSFFFQDVSVVTQIFF